MSQITVKLNAKLFEPILRAQQNKFKIGNTYSETVGVILMFIYLYTHEPVGVFGGKTSFEHVCEAKHASYEHAFHEFMLNWREFKLKGYQWLYAYTFRDQEFLEVE